MQKSYEEGVTMAKKNTEKKRGSRIPGFTVTRRTWVKLYCQEWINGTVRFQLSPEQRAVLTDLLAMAGNSRHPGVIAAGQTNGKYTPYPTAWLAATLNYDQDSFCESLRILEEQGRIKIEDDIITIVNWSKYQSEYQRQLPYRKGLTSKVTKKLPVEVEVEGEGEKKENASSASPFDASTGDYGIEELG
jgi:hypothetical protein